MAPTQRSSSPEIFACACRIIVIGMQLAYYGAAAIKVRDYTRKDTNGRATYTPIPDWGWILETVAGVLWLIIAAVSACKLLLPTSCLIMATIWLSLMYFFMY